MARTVFPRQGAARLARWLLAALLLAVPLAQASDAPPAEAFGLTPRVDAVAISPGGTALAWIDNTLAHPHIAIYDIASGNVRRVGDSDTSVKLRSLVWADDRTVLVRVSATAEVKANRVHRWEQWRLMAIDAAGGPPRMLLMKDKVRQFVSNAWLLSLHGSRPRTVIMATFDYNAAAQPHNRDSRIVARREDSPWEAAVYEVDLDTGKGTRVESGTQFTVDWIVDAAGKVVARGEWEPKEPRYTLLARNGGSWNRILELTDGEAPEVGGLLPDGSGIAVAAALGNPLRRALSVPLAGGEPRVLVSDPAFDVDALLSDPLTLAPAGASVGGARQSVTWFDPALAKRVAALGRSFKGQRVEIESRSADGMRVIATVDSPSRPPVHYLVDFAKGGADIVGESYPQLAQASLGEVSVLDYAARDGYPLVAYLTLPPGREAKKLPLVVLPHGGPESRDDFAFDWLAQFLATRGYAVVQPQFRGSTGFGEAHRLAGYRQWGQRMQDDVSDAVAALVQQGVADAGKTCIVGWSYGGYAALAGAAFTPELYACAASIAGVSDLPTMVGQERADGGDESNAVNYWKDHIGSQYDEAVIAASPARAAGKVRAPVLLLHGRSDTVVPVIQSRLMDEALRKAGKTVTLVEIDGEDHYMSMSETRVRMLHELEAFLAKYL